MRTKAVLLSLIITVVSVLCACGANTTPSGTPNDTINPIADAGFAEPSFVDYVITRLLYGTLNSDEQLFYRHFYNMVFSHPKYVAIPSGLDDDSVQKVFTYLKYDNPHVLCLSNTYTIITYGSGRYICPVYAHTKSTCEEYTAALMTKAKSMVAETKGTGNEYNRELYLHDTLLKFCSYDSSLTQSDAYSALINGKSMCTGYSMALKLLLDICSVSSGVVTGTATTKNGSDTHMWLCAEIDGRWYHIDPTWDDTAGDPNGNAVHIWFNVTTEEIEDTHSDFTLPKGTVCKSKQSNFYYKNNLICDGDNNAAIITKALKAAYDSGSDSAEIKFSDEGDLTLTATELFEDGSINAYVEHTGYADGIIVRHSEVASPSVMLIYITR